APALAEKMLEGSVVAVGPGRVPAVAGTRCHCAAGRSGRWSAGRPWLVLLDGCGATAAASTRGLRTGDLCGGVTKRWTDLVNFEFDRGALLAFLRFVRTLLQTPGSDDTATLGERSGDMLGEFTPNARAQEQCFAIFPLTCCAVVIARSGSDGEVGNGQSV